MTLFLLTFLSVYSAMNALVYFRARLFLPDRAGVQLLFILFLGLMVIAPIGVRLLERGGHEWPAKVLAHVGYDWMGFVFLTFWAFLAVGAFGLVFKLLSALTGAKLPSLAGKSFTAAVFAVVVLIWVYGYFEARGLKLEHITIRTDKLPHGMDRLKIAQISDVHLGLINGKERLEKIVELILAEQPDLLAATGDIVDGDMANNGDIQELLKGIQPRFGKYAVTGNHEFYAGLSQALDAIERSGFRTLRGEGTTVNGVLNIVGVDDPTGGNTTDEASLLASSRNGLFTLFLKHRPQVLEKSRGLFDLQLSGHTHRGQIFPFGIITGMVYPLQDGLHDLGGGSKVYASRGSGTWGPPLRVLSPPEVTIIELVR